MLLRMLDLVQQLETMLVPSLLRLRPLVHNSSKLLLYLLSLTMVASK